jgi:hypothetical protein
MIIRTRLAGSQMKVGVALVAVLCLAAVSFASTASATPYGATYEFSGGCNGGSHDNGGSAMFLQPTVGLDMPRVYASNLAPGTSQTVFYNEWLYKYTTAGWVYTGAGLSNYVTIPAGNRSQFSVLNYAQSGWLRSLTGSVFLPSTGGWYAIKVQFSWQTAPAQGSPAFLEQDTHWATFNNYSSAMCFIPS